MREAAVTCNPAYSVLRRRLRLFKFPAPLPGSCYSEYRGHCAPIRRVCWSAGGTHMLRCARVLTNVTSRVCSRSPVITQNSSRTFIRVKPLRDIFNCYSCPTVRALAFQFLDISPSSNISSPIEYHLGIIFVSYIYIFFVLTMW